MNATMAMEIQRCGATTSAGGNCKKHAGWGTDHVGVGTCRLHLGNTPVHRRAGARAQALDFAVGALGAQPDIDPLEGVLVAVRLSYGVVDYWRHRLAEPDTDMDRLHEPYSKSLDAFGRMCKLANDAGVAERQVKIVERMAERISLAAEEAMTAIQMEERERPRFIALFSQALSRLEAGTIDGTAEAA